MNNMNQMIFNNIGMNPMGMNFMQNNNNGMYPIGMNNQPNLMNGMEMDNTAQNIKNIIQPYENKIKELEEIIKQKDFEIIFLKQKLNNINYSNINNLNPMMINMNMNPMNLMMGNINQQMIEKGSKMSLTIISGDKKKCIEFFENDKASILYEKSNQTRGSLAFNYKVIDYDLTIKENGVCDHSLVYVNHNIKNIVFKNSTTGISNSITLSDDCPIGVALIHYYMKLGRINYIMTIINGGKPESIISFCDMKLEIEDKTPIKEIFKSNNNPHVEVILLLYFNKFTYYLKIKFN